MKKIIRVLSFLLVLSLIVPGFTFAENQASVSAKDEELYQKVTEKFRPNSDEEVELDSSNGLFKHDDEVRIIVELESDPSIVHATKRNVSYKDLSTANQIEREIEIEQKNVKNAIMSKNVDMEFHHYFKTTFNGFSGSVKYQDIEVIEKLPSVKNVYIANEYERPRIEPDMDSSNDMIGSVPTWNIGYKGEGTIIAIIDTGIDPSHKDMILSEDTTPRLTEELVESMNLQGKYYTEKVPYGYNYYDFNHEILDLGPGASEHGMHVAGISGANGNLEEGGIKGVAPEAQLMAMKVFSNDPIYATTFSDIYLVAIDEAVRLGADVLNMSLGSAASFYIPDSAEDLAITNATDNGIVCSVSAGNSGQLTYGFELMDPTYLGYPWKENPDIGLVGAPGLNKETIQVASIENINTKVNLLSYELDGEEYKVPMAIAGDINPATTLAGPQEFVDGGSGHPSELTDVEGKIALVVRGGLTPNFVDKIQNAQDAGAAGIIVRNHEDGGEELVNMATPDIMTIPAVFIGYEGGAALMELEEKALTFTDDLMTIPNLNANLISEFSSWGTTPSLELKPEITAPGGQIYSTLNDDEYGMMSGTSMAVPHVAGGSALVMEYIKEHEIYGNLDPAEQTRLAKVLLMNTANIILDEYEYEYSPRRIGAGLMNLYGAVSTPVRLVDAATNAAKVELKDFDDTTIAMNFRAINDSDEEARYDVDVTVLTDYIMDYNNAELNILSTEYLYDAIVDAPTTITVPANDEVEFEVTIDISEDSEVYWNMFVEGFVTLTDPNDEHARLSVPYVGFYGDWSEPDILDGMRFIDTEGKSYFNMSGMLYADLSGSAYYYGTPNRIYMSPGTLDGLIYGTDNVLPYLSFLRNAEVVNYNILDEDGNNLRTILTQQYYRKDYVDGAAYNPVAMVMDAWWFGDIDDEILPDGDYFYEIEAKIHYDEAEMQSKRIPITIDTVAPVIEDLTFDSETSKLTWDVVDSSGILGSIITINDEDIDEEPVSTNPEGRSFELDMSEYIGRNEVEITVVDNAYNIGTAGITTDIDNSDPYIFLLQPDLLNVYTENDVMFEGYVARFELLDKVLINDEEVEIEYLEHVDVPHPSDPSTILYSGPAYYFNETITLEDGYKEISVEAVSETGATGSIVRRFYVDTRAPELDIAIKEIDTELSTAELEIRMFDNLGDLKLYIGDSQIYTYSEPLVEVDSEEKVIDYTVDLIEGENVFVFTLVDIAGHETVETVLIDSSFIITNVQPAEDIELQAGETLDISFNAPTGGEGYYKVMLPFELSSNTEGKPMEETSTGLYIGTFTAPGGLVASNLQIEVVYIDTDGNRTARIANGKISISGDIEDLPTNSVIIGNEAYDMDYLNNNGNAQERFIEWTGSGHEVYMKLSGDIYVNEKGQPVDIENLPVKVIYFDADGNVYNYKR